MSLPQVQKLTIRHEAIMDFLLARPTATYREIAANFEVTVPWISCIVNSDVFQERLKEKQNGMFEAGVLAPLEDKMKGVVDLSLQRLAEKVQHSESLPELTNTADKLLGRLGYGVPNGNGGGGGGTNIFAPTLIERAQVLMGRANHNGSDSQPRGEGAIDSAPSIQYSPEPQRSESSGPSVRKESAPPTGIEV